MAIWTASSEGPLSCLEIVCACASNIAAALVDDVFMDVVELCTSSAATCSHMSGGL